MRTATPEILASLLDSIHVSSTSTQAFISQLKTIEPSSISSEQLKVLITRAIEYPVNLDVINALAEHRPLTPEEKRSTLDVTGYGLALTHAAKLGSMSNRAHLNLIKAGAPLDQYLEFDKIHKDASLNQALHWACLEHPFLIPELLKAGAPISTPNSKGLTPMLLAIKSGHSETIKIIAENRSLTAEERTQPNDPTGYGRALAVIAVVPSLTDIALSLIKAGAPMDQSCSYAERNNNPPLHHAAETANERLIRALLRAGANPAQIGKIDGGTGTAEQKALNYHRNDIASLIVKTSAEAAPHYKELSDQINRLAESLMPTQAANKAFVDLYKKFKKAEGDYFSGLSPSDDGILESLLKIKLNFTLLASGHSIDASSSFTRGVVSDAGASAAGAGGAASTAEAKTSVEAEDPDSDESTRAAGPTR